MVLFVKSCHVTKSLYIGKTSQGPKMPYSKKISKIGASVIKEALFPLVVLWVMNAMWCQGVTLFLPATSAHPI